MLRHEPLEWVGRRVLITGIEAVWRAAWICADGNDLRPSNDERVDLKAASTVVSIGASHGNQVPGVGVGDCATAVEGDGVTA